MKKIQNENLNENKNKNTLNSVWSSTKIGSLTEQILRRLKIFASRVVISASEKGPRSPQSPGKEAQREERIFKKMQRLPALCLPFP